ncbi:U-box domain-containing protein 19-like [Andrographis paniculata]|uniref:U-box domain-containing protein 19-like n=1 Tax=Andrographis paniculata TaxID=175694 RepID=UPI0021E7BE3B|nr:U-box domain-containing protein 19-like [Andrographis paniculata]
MINKSNGFVRRILNFPAIRPCDSVAVSTLLASLIDLGRRIRGFKSRFFFTNKTNARNSIRLIEALVVVLEEVRIGDLGFEASLSLCLSELHFILQKIEFLLEDCSRDDARLWMLLKSEKVSTQFRVLMRAVAVALEVVPLAGLDIGDEAADLVEFVRNQALKLEFQVEEDDRRAMVRVLEIVNQFEGGIAPESNDITGVLNHLGIRRWSECNKEVKFLEGEIGQECSSIPEGREFGFLNNLLTFMIYCRCTLFGDVDTSSTRDLHQSGRGSGNYNETFTSLDTDDFRCPITLEVMADPVTISTGHTYDRASILQWFGSGNHTCPKTGERLMCIDLVPNHSLKQIITRFQIENGVLLQDSESGAQKHGCASIKMPTGLGSVAAEQAMELLAAFLVQRLVVGTIEEQKKASYEIRLLTKTSIFNRSCMAEAGAVPPLLNLVCSDNPEAQDNAMAALLNLSKNHKCKATIVQNRGLELIVDVLTSGLKADARQHAAGALFYLTSTREYQRTVGRIPGAIPGLMKLIQDSPECGKKNALVTTLSLLMCPENQWRMLSAGLVPSVLTILTTSERENLTAHSLAILATLGENLDGAMAIVSAGALPLIVDILSSSTSTAAREFSVSLLLALCINDGADVVPILVKSPSVMASLYSLITSGTVRSTKKASSLIRILHAFNEKGSSRSTASTQEQFVHVW